MAKIVTITNPLTGQPAQVDQLDHTAQQIDDGLNIARGVSNPNLLDNWYFANPVNQRGQTSYTGSGYGIDRWKGEIGTTLLILSDRVRLLGAYQISQFFESPINGTVTVSVLFENRSGNAFKIFTNDGSTPVERASTYDDSGLMTVTFDATGITELLIGFRAGSATDAVDIKAAKIELGTQQTLAHQDADGNWVLKEIPNYGEQLRRCQRYAVKLNGKYWMPLNSDGALRLNIPLPVTMRAKPSVTFSQESQNTGTVSFDDHLSDENQIQFYMGANGGWVNVNNIFATADL